MAWSNRSVCRLGAGGPPANRRETITEPAFYTYATDCRRGWARLLSVIAGEEAELERWRRQSDAHRRAFDESCALWDDPALLAALRKAERELAYLPRRVDPKRGRRLLVPACATALVLAVLFWLDPWTRLQADHRTAVGERRSLTLEDGSRLRLNTDTAIALDLSANERRLRLLKGEVYCEVRPDPARPFIIEGAASHTRVTGTAFTVLSDGGSDTITVLRGEVKVMTRAGETRTLHPDEEITAEGDALGVVHRARGVAATDWVNGSLVFEQTPLGLAIARIQRYRHGAVWIREDRLRELKISARFDLRDPEVLLDTLAATLPIRLTRFTDWVVAIDAE